MELRDTIAIVAILVGPVTAVLITLWMQRRKERRDRQLNLFTTLMAHRRAFPPTYEWANALNLIDVVFADNPRVLTLWHELYDVLHNPSALPLHGHKYLELLSEMAVSLGFRHLRQTDIDKFYSPQAHGDHLAAQAEMQAQWLRVLKNTESFVVERKTEK